jgi:ATP-dependent helicase HrpA
MIRFFLSSSTFGVVKVGTFANTEFDKKKNTDNFLRMKQQDLLRKAPDETELAMFPDTLSLGSSEFKCTYRFDPGKDDDGLTIKVPLSAASTVPAETIDWLVPGLYREKLTALIKGLPKEYRKQLVPISDTVEVIINEMPGWLRILI